MIAASRHPVFARVFTVVVRMGDRSGMAEHRQEALAGLGGTVVEVGAGTGANFCHYPLTVTEVVALEPEPYLRHHAEAAALVAPVRVTVRSALAEDLPVPTGSADAVVSSLVLCSVGDPGAALAEMLRVVRPGGELRFYEHVRSGDPRRARTQERVDRVWPHLAGGCHTARDTLAAIEAAGWRVDSCRGFEFSPGRFPNPASPHIIGRAVRPL